MAAAAAAAVVSYAPAAGAVPGDEYNPHPGHGHGVPAGNASSLVDHTSLAFRAAVAGSGNSELMTQEPQQPLQGGWMIKTHGQLSVRSHDTLSHDFAKKESTGLAYPLGDPGDQSGLMGQIVWRIVGDDDSKTVMGSGMHQMPGQLCCFSANGMTADEAANLEPWGIAWDKFDSKKMLEGNGATSVIAVQEAGTGTVVVASEYDFFPGEAFSVGLPPAVTDPHTMKLIRPAISHPDRPGAYRHAMYPVAPYSVVEAIDEILHARNVGSKDSRAKLLGMYDDSGNDPFTVNEEGKALSATDATSLYMKSAYDAIMKFDHARICSQLPGSSPFLVGLTAFLKVMHLNGNALTMNRAGAIVHNAQVANHRYMWFAAKFTDLNAFVATPLLEIDAKGEELYRSAEALAAQKTAEAGGVPSSVLLQMLRLGAMKMSHVLNCAHAQMMHHAFAKIWGRFASRGFRGGSADIIKT